MPVPLHKKRRRARGYNQAELIAEGLGRAFEIPVDAASLIRKKNTVDVYKRQSQKLYLRDPGCTEQGVSVFSGYAFREIS